MKCYISDKQTCKLFLIKEGGVLKNRIYLHSAICIVIIFGLFACGGGKYAEAEKVMKKQADIGIAYVNDLERANSAKDVAKAIDTYTDEMEELIPDINKMMKDLPEVLNQEAPPKELAEESAQVAEASEKIQKASKKLFQYITNPEVQKALERMSVVMQKLNQQG